MGLEYIFSSMEFNEPVFFQECKFCFYKDIKDIKLTNNFQPPPNPKIDVLYVLKIMKSLLVFKTPSNIKAHILFRFTWTIHQDRPVDPLRLGYVFNLKCKYRQQCKKQFIRQLSESDHENCQIPISSIYLALYYRVSKWYTKEKQAWEFPLWYSALRI